MAFDSLWERSMKRGYKPAAQLPTYEKCMSDLTALNELMDGILDGVEALDDRQVTKRELVRDLDFTQNGIDLLRTYPKT